MNCRYLYYFENDNPVIQVRYISKLVALINEQKVGNIGRIASAVQIHYRNILGDVFFLSFKISIIPNTNTRNSNYLINMNIRLYPVSTTRSGYP